MKRADRDKFVSATSRTNILTDPSACHETPRPLFDALNAEFHFDVDLCAHERNHLCPVWFGPGGVLEDALAGGWIAHGRVGFCNPPYGRFIPQILTVALAQLQLHGFTSVFLLPVRVTRWFKTLVLPQAAEIRLCDRRLAFWMDGQPVLKPDKRTGALREEPALFDSMIVVYRPPVRSFADRDQDRVRVYRWATNSARRSPVDVIHQLPPEAQDERLQQGRDTEGRVDGLRGSGDEIGGVANGDEGTGGGVQTVDGARRERAVLRDGRAGHGLRLVRGAVLGDAPVPSGSPEALGVGVGEGG
jgi:phage N-6-adenine-methyltransferase